MISCFSVHDPERPDADPGDEPGDDPERATDLDESQLRSGIDSGAEAALPADADDEVAQAEARAEAARARLVLLRKAAETEDAGDDETSEDAGVPREIRRRRAKSGRKAVAIGAGVAVVASSLGAIGYMLQQHHIITHKRQLSQDYAAAARQAVTTLMSIDANHAKDDIQRIIDASTGPLKDQISVMSSLMLKQAEESKTITKVNVEAVAVESATDSSAVALVVAKSDVTDTDNKKRPPQLWRLTIEMVREGSQVKMSKVEFLQ